MKKCQSWEKAGSELPIFEINPRLDHSFRKFLVIRTASAIHSKTTFICSNGWSHPFENNPHPFERLKLLLSVQKNHHSFEWLKLSIQKKASVRKKKSSSTARSPAFRCWAVYKQLFTMKPFSHQSFEWLESCSKRFFSSSDDWCHPFEIVC